MLKQLRKQSGFTIIELLIVIAIIGILATLVLTNFRGAQAKGRDTVRQNDLNSMYQKLEEYYNENGFYPTADFSTTLFPGIDQGAFSDPDDNDIVQATPVAVVAPVVVPADPYTAGTKPTAAAPYLGQYTYSGYECTGTTPTTDTCAKYVLHAWSETETTNFSRNSLN